MNELWKYIEELDCYVSNIGRIAVMRKCILKYLKGWYTPLRYIRVQINNKQYLVSRLVLMAFDGKPENDNMEASHLNGNPNDNRIENLEWESHYDNMQRMKEHGTKQVGEKHPSAKLTLNEAQDIWNKWKWAGISKARIARKYNISWTLVSLIIKGKRWPEVKRV